MKKWIIRLSLAVAALIIVGLVVAFLSLNSIVKTGVESVGPQLAKVEMRLGGVKLSPFSGNGQLSDLFIGNPAGFKTPSAIKVGEIKVALQPGSLMTDTIIVNEVRIEAPEITFEGGLRGNNLSKILDNLEASAGGGKSEPGGPPASKRKRTFQVKEVVVKGGRINLSVTPLGGKAFTVPLPDIHIQNIGTADQAVSAAELSKQIMKPLLTSVTKAAGEAMARIGQDVQNLGKEGVEKLGKSAKGIKDLFKSKK